MRRLRNQPKIHRKDENGPTGFRKKSWQENKVQSENSGKSQRDNQCNETVPRDKPQYQADIDTKREEDK